MSSYCKETSLLELTRDHSGRIAGVVRCHIKTVIGCRHDAFTRRLALKLTGCYDVAEVNYAIVGHDGDDLLLLVSGTVSEKAWQKVLEEQEKLAWQEYYGL